MFYFQVYQMTYRRGMALIINNKHFTPGIENRDGSEVDFRMIKTMFSEFHFKIIAECDKTASVSQCLTTKQKHTQF